MLFWGITLGFAGKVLLAVSVLLVHNKITDEKRIDGIVLMEMRHEQIIAIIGLVLMVVGYLLEMFYFGFIPGFIASAAAI